METPPPSATPPALSERQWATIIHLSGLAWVFLSLGGIVAPLVIWLIKREGSPRLDVVGREVVNFQISYAIYMWICGLLMFVLVGFILFPIVWIAWLVLTIIGAVKASNGEDYRFPVTMRLL